MNFTQNITFLGLFLSTLLGFSTQASAQQEPLLLSPELSKIPIKTQAASTRGADAYPVVWAVGSQYINLREHFGVQLIISKFIRNQGGTGPDAGIINYPLKSACYDPRIAMDSSGQLYGGFHHLNGQTFVLRYENPESAVGEVGCYLEPVPNPPTYVQISSSAGFVFDSLGIEHLIHYATLGMKFTPSQNITLNFNGTSTDGDIVGGAHGKYYILFGKKIVQLDENFNWITVFPEACPVGSGVGTYGLASAWGGEELYIFATNGSVWMFRPSEQAWTNMIPADENFYWRDAASPPSQ